ncbi:aminotransferase class I/II-fold pyridoxal phosphate-dependent enzyme [Amaricoccus macauensis]|uniref:aminotransferase class I/II-fold pyridoxal phosphate-dependent enzyme n=1 Tax=Amaricoccus macauensis TaxID=57001 RepID=UPI003C7CCCAE
MQYPQRFSDLPEYAFPRLRRLLGDVPAGGPDIHMTIGEPKHALPDQIGPAIAANLAGFSKYPPNEGAPELRLAISGWLARRYGVELDADTEILPLNGTREGLFNAAIALCPENKSSRQPVILMPNPFYQCYGTAALAVGAEPIYLSATARTGFLPDFNSVPADILARTTLAYICSPANPQGTVATEAYWRDLIALAETHDFRILADECYCEIYRDTPPPGVLQVVRTMGADPERVLAFHSLSKRSSAPGLRSGFVAGGPGAIRAMLQLRSYSGAPLPLPLQHAAASLWNDEKHVEESRALYREKFAIADRILGGLAGYTSPQAGFFLWLGVADGERAAVEIYRRTGVRVLPGAYLSRDAADGTNPGAAYIRIALVAEAREVETGLTAIRNTLEDMPELKGTD